MEILGKILGSPARVKIMRLFLLNRSDKFGAKEVAKRSRVSLPLARRELKLLAAVGFLKKHSRDWIFNPSFKYKDEFEGLLLRSESLSHDTILENFKKTGRLKLLLISGIFIKNPDSRVDMLIVGDRLKKNRIEEGMRKLEAEIGTELVYAIFDTKEFVYRLDMYDKLVRDILDFPHQVILRAKEINIGKAARPPQTL